MRNPWLTLSYFTALGLLAGAAGCSAGDDAPAPSEPAESLGTAASALVQSAGKRSFIHFESGPVRPMAMSADGTKLFVTNIPDSRLEIFGVDGTGALTPQASVRVGLEPVAVAVRNASEVWVVNHLSDSVSVVDVASNPPRVSRTLLVGDEPRDVVFAGAGNSRAFITTAHRGQNRSLVAANLFTTATQDPQLFTPGVPRADVWVYDPANLGTTLGGTPLKVLELFGDTPRPLAVSPDGNTVYAGVHFSGNQTSTVSATAVCDGFLPNTPCTMNGVTYPGGDFGPAQSVAGVHAPDVGLIVKWNAAANRWEDKIGRDWNSGVMLRLPDKDVFAINVSTLTESKNFRTVGTTLMNMVANPVTGKLYVSNLDSNNLARFEGPGTHGSVQGNLAKTRITIIDPVASTVNPRHLNKHIDYSVLKAPASVRDASLSMPLQMAVTANGQKLYVAAFGSDKIGVYDTAALEANSFDPYTTAPNHITVPGGGPSGLVLSESKSRMYVMNRFDNSVSVINTGTKAETQHLKMLNPEPAHVTKGRKFLYDAKISSSNGEASCASCHIFGDTDHISWDLGNPDGGLVTTPVPFHLEEATTVLGGLDPEVGPQVQAVAQIINGTGVLRNLHPMKGPMATQTLRGMQNHGPLHWRGDRVNGFFGEDPKARSGPPFDARHNFLNFIVAFDGLVGRSGTIPNADMQAFADFAMELLLPPNPIRNLDNSLTSAQENGRKYYFGCTGTDSALLLPVVCGEGYDGNGGVLDPATKGHGAAGTPLLAIYETCNSCHVQDPAKGYFGTDGQMAFDQITQAMKVPHFRNAYTKVGMFGQHKSHLQNQTPDLGVNQGDQIRGFGFQSSGAMDQLFHFFNGLQFNGRMGGIIGFQNDQQRRDVVSFVMASPTDLAPIVGQQVTLTSANSAAVGPRIDLMVARAKAAFWSKELGSGVNECELIASAAVSGKQRGWLFRAAANNFEPDDSSAPISDASLRALAATAGQQVTYTCVAPGSGTRLALDRDMDGYPNQNDLCPDDQTNKCKTCSGTTMDCNNDKIPCTTQTATNVTHYNSGRATRDRDCLLLICGDWRYYAVGSGVSLGGDNTTTTLYTSNGSSWSTTSCVGNGCETDGSNNVNHCGACGRSCAYANAGASCVASTCQMGACAAGFMNCNNNAGDGCEANLQTDVANCGACGRSCSVGEACVAGNCQCAPNRSNCDGIATNGCEVDLSKDLQHCGNCTTVCSYANAGAACVNSACAVGACSAGFGNCNGSNADGCEKNLMTDMANCGTCGRACASGPNGAAACEQGTCSFTCTAGYSDCDNNAANGCERLGACVPIAKQKIAGGTKFTCAITSTGGTACWGTNNFGQLGRGTSTEMETNKVAISGLGGVTQVAAGRDHACALLNTGGVRCWGANGKGQLGDNSTSQRTSPVVVSGLSDAIWIAAGEFHTCAVRLAGSVVCWGEGSDGRLGNGGSSNRLVPTAVSNLTDAAQVAAGIDSTCALRNNGRVACWGSGTFGQLGNGGTSPSAVPVAVLNVIDGAQIGMGNNHGIVLRANGQVQAWGRNTEGQLGNNTTTSSSTAVTVSNLLDAKYVTGGGFHSCAVRTTNAAACWGDNDQGTIGDGTTTRRLVPTAVSTLANVSQIVGSRRIDYTDYFLGIPQASYKWVDTCAALSNGQYACWGDNTESQIGNGASGSTTVKTPFVFTAP